MSQHYSILNGMQTDIAKSMLLSRSEFFSFFFNNIVSENFGSFVFLRGIFAIISGF